jgi:bifunctional DNase/RNase
MCDSVRLKVKGVCVAETSEGILAPVVLMEDESHRMIPLFVGLAEAISIHQALSGNISPRPTTHDLFISTLERLNAKVTDVLIDDLDGGVYYARLTVSVDSARQEIDARPSDCMALALRSGAHIHIKEDVMAEACIDKENLGELKEIKDFI